MAKWQNGKIVFILLVIFISFWIFGGTVNATECQISSDNESWSNITASVWGGCIDDTNDLAYMQNLECNTQYYIRCKTPATEWGYKNQKTGGCGIDKMAIAVILGLIGIAGILIYMSISLKEEKYLPIKILLWFIVLFLILIILSIASVIATNENYNPNISMAYQICLWSFVFVMGYFIIIFIRETVLSSREKTKRKMEGEE